MDQPFNAINDPLGQLINLQSQARQRRFATAVSDPSSIVGPLPDPNWDAYFGAVQNAAGDKSVKFAGSTGPDLGYDTNNGTMGAGIETYGPKGLRFSGPTPALQGLQAAGAPVSTPPTKLDINLDDDRAITNPYDTPVVSKSSNAADTKSTVARKQKGMK